MGIVYRVEQIFLKKEFALKTIDKQFLSDISIKRFEHEARASFAVDHPNIISVNDFGLLDERTPFLVMEIVKGTTLASLIASKGSLEIDDAIPIFVQTCLGLAHAHESGIVHRDIKPSNIMILDERMDDDSYVKILDFGIAKIAGGEHENVQALTKTGDVFGSPLYMSPEQCNSGKIDHRSDIYSLGCVIFEGLTGTPPFVGENALMTMMQHQSAEIPTLREASLGKEFPAKLEELVRTMLAKRPEDRCQNLGLVAIDLAAMRSDKPLVVKEDKTLASRSPAPQPVEKSEELTMQPISFALILLAVAAVSSLLTVAALTMNSQPKPVAPKIAEALPTPPKTPQGYDNELSNIFIPKIKAGENRFKARGLINDKTLEGFRGYSGVQSIDMCDTDITDAGLAHFDKSNLLEIILRNSHLRSVDNICKQQYLQKLDIHGAEIGDEALAKLAQLKSLTSLDLGKCAKLTPSGLSALCASKSLVSVTLPSGIPSSVVAKLHNNMPQCTFPGYYPLSKVAEWDAKFAKLPVFERYERICKLSDAANPNNFTAVALMTVLADILQRENRKNESLALRFKAAAAVEKSGNQFVYSETLRQMSNYAQSKGEYKKANSLNDRAFKLYFDTHFHDTPDFIDTIMSFTDYPVAAKDFKKAIEFCEVGLDSLRKFPHLSRKYLPTFLEKIGWCYIVKGEKEKALPYLQENEEILRSESKLNPVLYARAIIEMAHCKPDFEERISLYLKGIQMIENLKFPDTYNLPEHYSDATASLSLIYAAKNQPTEAIKYARKGLALFESLKERPGKKARIDEFRSILSQQLEKAGQHAEAEEIKRKMN